MLSCLRAARAIARRQSSRPCLRDDLQERQRRRRHLAAERLVEDRQPLFVRQPRRLQRLVELRQLVEHVADERFQLFDDLLRLAGLLRRAEQRLGIDGAQVLPSRHRSVVLAFGHEFRSVFSSRTLVRLDLSSTSKTG